MATFFRLHLVCCLCMLESGEVSPHWARYSFADEVLAFLCRDEHAGLLEIVNQQMRELLLATFIFHVIEQAFNGIEFVHPALVRDRLCCVLPVYDGHFTVTAHVFTVVDVLRLWRAGA